MINKVMQKTKDDAKNKFLDQLSKLTNLSSLNNLTDISNSFLARNMLKF